MQSSSMMEQDARISASNQELQTRSSSDHQQGSRSLEKPQQNGHRRPSGSSRTCGKCGGSLTGQFVRALEGTFHLECFTCHECGKIVASKFFPVPDQPPNQYPLCEIDYFKRLDLLCHACGGALRGSYITALDRKYHIEHFTCSVCPTVFGAQDSYYEHEGSIYCHYHYSTKFAQKCNGCQTAILKQFVEIYRNGENQHWHPECYMIHKYWNVRLHSTDQPLPIDGPAGHIEATESERKKVRQDEEQIEDKVLWIWRTLSAYEEKSATCISDMLLHVSNGAYVDGVMSAKRFILHVDLLFAGADDLDRIMVLKTSKGLSYSREAKLLCKKVVAFFQLLAESQETGVRRLGVTQELLSLVTGLAHYLKLLIRICLQGSLKLEREAGTEQGLQQFLDTINSLDTKLATEDKDTALDTTDYVKRSADTCPICKKAVEDRCARHQAQVFHWGCMECEKCRRDLRQDLENARWNTRDEKLQCRGCAGDDTYAEADFVGVSRLKQYVHLLRVAHARLLATLRSSGALPHTSDDPNLNQYDSSGGHGEKSNPPMLRSDSRSKSYAGRTSAEETSYEQTLGDIRRLRSTRMDKQLSSATKRARTSRIIVGPEGNRERPKSAEGDGDGSNKGFHVMRDRETQGDRMSQLAFGGTDSIRLDDIPRLVAAEQAKEQRPNANKYARGNLMQSEPKPILVQSHARDGSGAHELEKLGPEGHRPKRYFSELSALEYFIVNHVAVLSMTPLLEGYFNQEELLDLIEMRKPTFWGKFGKAFKNDKVKGSKKKNGVFGLPLDVLIERDGAESTDGIGPGALRVPALVQDTIQAMRTMDMSVEGVFRKNGNIRRLKEMAEAIDIKGNDAVAFDDESPVQVAALLKKFLRELPDPVMTYKLHKLFIISQKIPDEEKRRRVLHLTCCLLPKTHRDTMEVLFCFLNWVASFSVVDEESGSKMDVHNLATVIAPNILFPNSKTEGMEESFLAIEAINTLIESNASMSEVPEDLQSILNDSSVFSTNPEVTTKEILKRYDYIGKPVSQNTFDINKTSETPTGRSRGSNGANAVVTHVDSEPAQATAHHAESSGRPMQSQHPYSIASVQQTPPQAPNGFYANSAAGSRDSFGANNSPNRLGQRNLPVREREHQPSQSNGQMGVT